MTYRKVLLSFYCIHLTDFIAEFNIAAMYSCYCCISEEKKCLMSEKSDQCDTYICMSALCDLMMSSAELYCVKNKLCHLCKEKTETKVRK